jgi:hypothetical protein
MRRNNPLVLFSIFCIRKVWHGPPGRSYKKRKGILCRFHPSCSNYAILALQKYGFITGWCMAYRRLRRCNRSNTESCIDYP